MKPILVPGLLIVAVVLSSCCCVPCGAVRGVGVAGSGRMVTREYPLRDFSRVEAGNAFRVDIARAEGYGVAVTADDNVIDYLDVTTAGDTLRLRLKPGRSYNNVTLRARVTLPELRGLGLSGASRGTVTGLSSTSGLSLDLSGASTLDGDIRAGDTTLTASGASRATLRGAGGNLRLDGSGGSVVDLGSYPTGDARVSLSGASRATVNAAGRLDADLSGASRLEYLGQPTLGKVSTSGGASIQAR